MNQAHVHLLFNHLPIFGSILAAIVLAYGMKTKSLQTQNASFLVMIISAIGAAITQLTGEGAEEVVENLQGVSKQMIEEHEEMAAISFGAMILLGVLSIIAMFLSSRKSTSLPILAKVILVISVISFGLLARTGNSGGKIRHSEFNSGAVSNSGGGEHERDDD
ncbi:MAG: hypothetical protein IPP51_16865 [Bacteroidetes bacterium]|nr:hypothetical protein [Bacteroidota bacterium]